MMRLSRSFEIAAALAFVAAVLNIGAGEYGHFLLCLVVAILSWVLARRYSAKAQRED